MPRKGNGSGLLPLTFSLPRAQKVTTLPSQPHHRSRLPTVIYGVTGSFGGELNSILKRPLNTGRLQVGAEVGSYDSTSVSFDVTGPLASDGSVSGRLIGKYDEFDLPLDIKGESFPQYESMFLGSINWDISSQTSLLVTYYHQQRNTDPWDGGALIQEPDGSLSLPKVDPESWYFSHPDQSKETLEVDFGVIELEHEFGNGWRSKSQLQRLVFVKPELANFE